MLQAQQRAPFGGPAFIRLLTRLAHADVSPSSRSLNGQLSQWFDWKHALALSTALDGRPAVTQGDDAPMPDNDAAECARVRDALVGAIRDDPTLATHGVQSALLPSSDDAPADFTPFRHCYRARQRAMQAATGRLRGRLRDALAQTSPEMAHLAEVDAVMELALSPREHSLLATVPDLLGRRFEHLREAGPASRGWLDTFRRDMQGVLLAELDVRFQPVEGLLAALRTH